jgi:dienelactone hydrolase
MPDSSAKSFHRIEAETVAVERVSYEAGGKTFTGALIYDDKASGRRPLMLMAPNWLGVTDDAIRRTEMMTGSRYIGFVADMYGEGRVSAGPPEAAELADSLRSDPAGRRLRIAAGLAALVKESEGRGIGDPTRKAAVGFCFGGGNVLELARAGADVQATVCLHGDLTTRAQPARPGEIKSALLVLHGSADPVSDKSQRDAFEAEMTAAKARWQMLVFGAAVHSFCEAETNVPGIAEYNEPAARQSYRLLDRFIADAFEGLL